MLYDKKKKEVELFDG